jgi:uncharacterized protein (TIRG00374 family)
MTDNPLAIETSRARVWTQRLLALVVFAGALYLVHRLVSEVGWQEVRARLAHVRPRWVVLAVACFLLQLSFWAARQRLSVRRITATPRGWVIALALVATAAANFLLPFARLLGGLLRARFLSRASSPRAPKRIYYAAVLFDQLVHFVIMGTVTIAGLLGAALVLGRTRVALGMAAVLAAAALVALFWYRRRAGTRSAFVRFFERQAERREGMIGKVLAGSETAARIFLRLVRSGRLWWRTLALGLCVFLAVAAAQWAVFRALGAEVHPLVVVATVTMGLSAGVLLGTPGGLGTTEATMIALYGAFGVDRVVAASAVLLFRGLQFVVVLGLGLPAMAVLELHSLRVRRSTDETLAVEEAIWHAGHAEEGGHPQGAQGERAGAGGGAP